MVSTIKYNLDLGGGSLMQIANRSSSQMMSYIMDSPNGNVIVIDGGMYCNEDANNLYRELEKRGKKVALWFFTHCHVDHYGAFLRLVERSDFDIIIDKICFNFPRRDWLMTKEDKSYTEQFFSVMDHSNFSIVTPKYGDVFECGGINIEVLNEPINYENYPSINPTGIILKVHFPKRDVLFLGDYDICAEEDYQKNFSIEKLRCDIVQMAHHGQNGVSRNFYEWIKPKYCLYTAPDWLWENNIYGCNNPDTRGKGNFTTLETRRWMAEMNVIRSFHLGEGDWLFN